MIVLGIETSCDDTSLALVEDGRRVLASRISSQVATHAPYGGVVPELAAREHLATLPALLELVLADAGMPLGAVDAVAGVHGPGLLGALLVGLAAAKSLALALDRPFIGVNHLQAHLFANFIETGPETLGSPGGAGDPGTQSLFAEKTGEKGYVPGFPAGKTGEKGHVPGFPGESGGRPVFSGESRQISVVPPTQPSSLCLDFPFVGLVVSGGHTLLLDVADSGSFRVLGRTTDDAAGEVLDKLARLAGLPFPGGKHVEQHAKSGDPRAVALPRPTASSGPLDFSFSGLKTAAALALRSGKHSLPDLLAALQQAVIDCLASRAEEALRRTGRNRLVMAGGVTANRSLLEQLRQRCARLDVAVHCPPPWLCTDNAAMVCSLGYFRLARGERSPLSLDAVAQLEPDAA